MTFFKTIRRPAALLATIVVLAACGGKAGFPINGTVSGLQYDGLVLSTNGMSLTVPKGATSFSFPNSISYGEVYNVTTTAQPAHQNCTATDPGGQPATDSAGHTTSINIIVTCATNTHILSGTVTNLTTDGLTLTNGSTGGVVTVAANATAFTFTNHVAYGLSYGVTVLTQPKDAICTLDNAAGIMGDADVNNVVVRCTSTLPTP